MNGMARKAATRRHRLKYTDEGLPRDPKDWTEEDWRDLHEALETIKRKVSERHARSMREVPGSSGAE